MLHYLGSSVEGYFSTTDAAEWKYILVTLFTLKKFAEEVENSGEILSVKESKNLKAHINQLTRVGINSKLQPCLPLYVKEKYTKTDDIFYEYNIMKSTVFALCELISYPCLRTAIITQSLRSLLVALYQISYCPLKKSNLQLTQAIWDRLQSDREIGICFLKSLREDILPSIYVKETMTIVGEKSPPWFKRALSRTLTDILYSANGLENISIAMLDGSTNDNGDTWKALDIISRLVLSCKENENFKSTIGEQLFTMLNKTRHGSLLYERVFISCVQALYTQDEVLGEFFLGKIVGRLGDYTNFKSKLPEADLEVLIQQNVRLVHSLFIENTVNCKPPPLGILTPFLDVIFRFYCITSGSAFKTLAKETKEILLKCFSESSGVLFEIFDGLIFRMHGPTLPFRSDIFLVIEGRSISLSYPGYSVIYSVAENLENLFKLSEDKIEVLYKFFRYLLHCIVYSDKYFEKPLKGRLGLDEKTCMSVFEENLMVYKLLSDLSENKSIQEKLVECPGDIINFVESVLQKSIKDNIHKGDRVESNEFQSLFVVIMVLHALVSNESIRTACERETLVDRLRLIAHGTSNAELSDLIQKILLACNKSSPPAPSISPIPEKQTEFERALADICDPLLPVRGHGLMTMKKLIEKKDPQVVNRKHYVINILQQHLKDADSFIYLSAIDGLASMANMFPDLVLQILCEEYSEFARQEDDHETRIKLGESLVRVIKLLDEMAPKYKALLLNTFLNVSKHEDYLVRASSLSNLGEVCRVLGYKLGTMVTEILACVHGVIATDKAADARRAAVTVLRQLLVGLGADFVQFLKEEILPIYRTLKSVYQSDADDVMRLQAQLALEELDENTRNFLFSEPVLNLDKHAIKFS
ncbi:transport and Golgi organization protein 6 homolog isoform X2 [Cylas formicarius]|nr:transport and Golgi organization protein 6 homolog isoform X2 [Cylas formicarius]